MYGKTRITPRMTWCYERLDERIVRYRSYEFTTEPFTVWLMTLRYRIAEKTRLLLMQVFRRKDSCKH